MLDKSYGPLKIAKLQFNTLMSGETRDKRTRDTNCMIL